jgi:hypothetical protein
LAGPNFTQKIWGGLLWILSLALTIKGSDESQSQGTQMQLKEEFDILASDQYAKLQRHKRLSLTSKRLCELICQLIRYSVQNKNPKLLGNILSIVLLIVDQRQLFVIVSSEEVTEVSSFLLYGCVNALVHPGEQLRVWPTEGSFENDPKATLSEDLKLLFHELSDILPGILPTSSGFSRQAINFLNSKRLCIPWGCFGFDHLVDYNFFFKTATQSTTILPADSVLCAVSESEDVGHIFNQVWVPFGPDRLLGYTGHFLDSAVKKLEESIGERWKDRVMWASLAMVFTVLVVPCALAALALYPSVLIYVYLVHGFGAYTGTQEKLNSGQKEEPHALKLLMMMHLATRNLATKFMKIRHAKKAS